MVTGRKVFDGKHRSNSRSAILKLPSKDLSADCRDLITRLLNKDPSSRLGAHGGGPDEILLHPWF